MPLRDFFLVLLICLAWAGNFLTSAFALREVPPFLFSAVRLALLGAMLVAFVRLPPRDQWPAFEFTLGLAHDGGFFGVDQGGSSIGKTTIGIAVGRMALGLDDRLGGFADRWGRRGHRNHPYSRRCRSR